MNLTNAAVQAEANAIIALIDAGAAGGQIRAYTGTQPATADTALSGNTLLATATCATTCGTASNGVITFASITSDTSIDADGTGTWCRITDSDGTSVLDITMATSGADLNVDSTTFTTGETFAISSLVLTVTKSA